MKTKRISRALRMAILLILFCLIAAGEFAVPATATVQMQNSCEQEWCVCSGYTADRLKYDEETATYDWDGDPISSECFKWFYIWRKYNNSDRDGFLAYAQSECDNCTAGSEPSEAPETSDEAQPSQLPCEEDVDRDCDGVPDDVDLCPNLPGAHPGDMDCDDIPDDIDLCIGQVGESQDCGCSDTGVAPGDLLFRKGMPAKASLYLPALVGTATSEGEEYNFGHVGMYAGSFWADQEFPVLHEKGLKVYRQASEDEQPVLVMLAKGDRVLPGDIVPDAVLESDWGWGGVGISNLENFLADNASFSGSEYYGVKVGTPRQRLNCQQRLDVVDYMADSARSRADGVEDYSITTENCADKVSGAYEKGAGYAPWEEFREDTPLNIWENKVLTPNMVASFSTLNGIYSERRDIPQDSHIDEPRITIEAHSPVYLHVYDSQGRHTGAAQEGLEANIPSSEVWYMENGLKVINLLAPQDEPYDILIEGYEGGSYEIFIAGVNLPSSGSVTKILYPETPIQPGMTAGIHFSPRKMNADALTMSLDHDQDGTPDSRIEPVITQGSLSGARSEPVRLPTPLSGAGWIVWGVLPGLFCIGASLVVLVAGFFVNNKKLRLLGVVLLAVVACILMIAVVFYGVSRWMEPEGMTSDDDPAPSVDAGQQPGDDDVTSAAQAPAATTTSTDAPETSPPLEVYPQPAIYNLATCPEPCLDDLSNQSTVFPEKTERIYVYFDYDWVPPGADYVRVWKNNEREWIRYQCQWDGSESGSFETSLREPAGLHSGNWIMEIYVNGEMILQTSVTVEGSYDYWAPAGTINRCK